VYTQFQRAGIHNRLEHAPYKLVFVIPRWNVRLVWTRWINLRGLARKIGKKLPNWVKTSVVMN